MGYVQILVFWALLSITLGSPELSSSTSSLELSGEVCPGYITLICSKNTTERIFVWYTNDNELARFDEEDVTPFTIKTRLDLFNATIRVTSVVEVNGYFSFDNFTLTARVSDFLPIQGQNLTCGTRLDKSEPFRVDNFTVSRREFINPGEIAVISNVTGNDEVLKITWTISGSQCEEIEYNFRVILRYSTTSVNRNVSCSSNCEAQFPAVPNVNEYVINVLAINSQGELVGTPTSINISTDRITPNNSSSHTLKIFACEAALKCISVVDGECVFEIMRNGMIEQTQKGAVNSSVIFSDLMPNTLYFYHINFISQQHNEMGNFTTDTGVCAPLHTTSTTKVMESITLFLLVVLIVFMLFMLAILLSLAFWLRRRHKKAGIRNYSFDKGKRNVNNVKADTQELIVNEERIDVENLVTTSDTSMGEQLTDVRLRIMEERRDIEKAQSKDITSYDTEQIELREFTTVRASIYEELEKLNKVTSHTSCVDEGDEIHIIRNTTYIMDNRKIIYRNNAAMEWTWKEHNFSMIFHSENLKNTIEESKLEIAVIHSDDYVLPPMTVPVSAFFSVECQHKFHKNVTLRIEHFSVDTSSLKFVVSHSTHPPFMFEFLSGGVFSIRHGEIERREFCIFGIVYRCLRCRRRPRLYYYCALYTSPSVFCTWTVRIYIVKDSATNKNYIEEDTKGLELSLNAFTVANVIPSLVYFTFDLTLSKEEMKQGWSLPPGITNLINIQRARIDDCQGVATPASFKILLDASKAPKQCKLIHSYKIADVEEDGGTMTMILFHQCFERNGCETPGIKSSSTLDFEELQHQRSKLVIGLKFEMNWLASELFALGILSSQHKSDITNTRSTLNEDEKANIMVSAIMDKLVLDSNNLISILNVLRNKAILYKETIALLEDKKLWNTTE